MKSWISGQQLCPIATYQPNNFSSLADNFKVFEAFEDEGDVEREYRNQINHVHWLSHEPDKDYFQYFVKKKALDCSPSLVWADDESYGKLEGEENHNKIVQKLDDENHPRKVNISRLILQTF